MGTFLGIDKPPGYLTISGTTVIVFGIYTIDKTMREKREAEGGDGEYPINDNHSMFISRKVITNVS